MHKIFIYLSIFLFLININNLFAKNIQVLSDDFDGTVMPVEINLPNYFDSLKGDKLAKRVFITSYLGKYYKTGIENIGNHPGVDIILPLNTPIRAIANGVVVNASNNRWSSGAGRFVVIKHSNVPYKDDFGNIKYSDLYSAYEHLNYVYVNIGQKVKKGQLIGLSGNTGNSSTPHLHIQIDLPDAPYHPLYSRSMQINKKYTIHPIKWIYDFLNESNVEKINFDIAKNIDNKIKKDDNKKQKQISPNINDDIFLDINKSHKNYQAIKYLVEKGIMRGEFDGKFYPDKKITRLDFWNFLTDISDYHENIKISRPFDFLTLVEALKFIYLVWDIKIEYTNEIFSIYDLSKKEWYYYLVIDALNRGYIEAQNGQVNPNKFLTKSEIAQILYNLNKF